MKLPPLKREKFADQLTWLANRQALGMPEDRRHERIVPRTPNTTLILPNGREYIAGSSTFRFRAPWCPPRSTCRSARR